jgi:hypothetical protein
MDLAREIYQPAESWIPGIIRGLRVDPSPVAES